MERAKDRQKYLYFITKGKGGKDTSMSSLNFAVNAFPPEQRDLFLKAFYQIVEVGFSRGLVPEIVEEEKNKPVLDTEGIRGPRVVWKRLGEI